MTTGRTDRRRRPRDAPAAGARGRGGRASLAGRPGGSRGFSLLEVMVALAILAFLMAAITSTQGTSLMHGARVYNLTTATQLVDGVVMGLQEEYEQEGFPENTIEEEDCELPEGHDEFDCEYDLKALEVKQENISSMGEQASSMVENSPLMNALCSGGSSGQGLAGDPRQALQDVGQSAASVGALRALVNPQFAQLCHVNLQQMCSNIPMLTSFVPSIVKQASKSTRKLVVRITWSEHGAADKTLKVETFIISVPSPDEEREQAGGGRGA